MPRLRPRFRLRLLPLAMAASVLLFAAKIERLFQELPPRLSAAQAQAQAQPPVQAPAPAPPSRPPGAAEPAAEPAAAAERALLESLRARRAEIDQREQHAASREILVAAAERRLAQRVEELMALQQRMEALERERGAREEVGLRGLVRLYEGMRPRDAANIFNELEMPVLVHIVDRMREAKAAPVMGAMRAERARHVTAELARLRAERQETR